MAQTDNLPETIVINDHWQGDTFPGERYTITMNGAVRDLTGATIRMTFLLGNRRDGNEKELTIGDGVTIVDGPNGVMDMDEIAADDMDWNAGTWYYDIEITYADLLRKTPVIGTWKIHQDKSNNT